MQRLLILAILGSHLAFAEMNTKTYILSTGEKDLERISIINDLYNPASLEFFDAQPGMRVLTFGCGIGLFEMEVAKRVGSVLATDISPLQLAIARNHSSLPNLTFQELDIAKIGEVPGLFDRIYCRFVLSHFPFTTVQGLIPLLMSKLTPGGELILDEISTLHRFPCEPASEAFDIWVGFVHKQFQTQGADLAPGNRILTYLQTSGYRVEHRLFQPVVMTHRDKMVYSLGVHSVAPRMIDKGTITQEEADEVALRLRELEEDPGIRPSYVEMIQMRIKQG